MSRRPDINATYREGSKIDCGPDNGMFEHWMFDLQMLTRGTLRPRLIHHWPWCYRYHCERNNNATASTNHSFVSTPPRGMMARAPHHELGRCGASSCSCACTAPPEATTTRTKTKKSIRNRFYMLETCLLTLLLHLSVYFPFSTPPRSWWIYCILGHKSGTACTCCPAFVP